MTRNQSNGIHYAILVFVALMLILVLTSECSAPDVSTIHGIRHTNMRGQWYALSLPPGVSEDRTILGMMAPDGVEWMTARGYVRKHSACQVRWYMEATI